MFLLKLDYYMQKPVLEAGDQYMDLLSLINLIEVYCLGIFAESM